LSPATTEQFTASAADAGRRVDVVLAERFPDLSRNRVQHLVDDGFVLVNDQPPRRASRLAEGDAVECTIPERTTKVEADPDIAFSTIHAGDDVIAIDKPAGLAVHPGAGRPDGTLVNGLLARYPEIAAVGGAERPGIVHRLDMDTSGVMLVARTEAAHHSLVEQFGDRKVQKTYVALVAGSFPHASGTIEAPIGRSTADPRRMEVDWSGQPALSEFRRVARTDDASLLELDLVTGRTHQARVHLAAVGFAVLGDPVYGTDGGADRQMLHAWRIAADLPDGTRLTARAGLHADMLQALADFDIDGAGYGATDWAVDQGG
jgi:23S rRNA pseudouridine1911/1915/1917 synthase